MTKDDFCLKDEDGKPIRLDTTDMKYVLGHKLIDDLYNNESIIETSQNMARFFFELRCTFIGLIGGIEKKSRSDFITYQFMLIDELKKDIVDTLLKIENER